MKSGKKWKKEAMDALTAFEMEMAFHSKRKNILLEI
jgi:hypothetical protein